MTRRSQAVKDSSAEWTPVEQAVQAGRICQYARDVVLLRFAPMLRAFPQIKIWKMKNEGCRCPSPAYGRQRVCY